MEISNDNYNESPKTPKPELTDNELLRKYNAQQKKLKEIKKEETQKEKLLKYMSVADFSYIDLKKVGGEYQVAQVNLDTYSFPDKNRLFIKPKPKDLNEDEKFVYEYIEKNKNNEGNLTINYKNLPDDIKTICKIEEKNYQLAYNDNVKSDVGVNPIQQIYSLQNKDVLYVNALQKLKQEKSKKVNIDSIEMEYKIIDSFPRNGEKSKSGFGGVILEDLETKEKIVALRGTEPTKKGDLKADANLAFGNVPLDQCQDMLNFINKNIKPGEKFNVAGHSLGGALSQIATLMYGEQIKETYTFNSPGVKNLYVDTTKIKENVEFFKKFNKNKSDNDIANLITNVRGTAFWEPIASLGIDVGNNEIKLKNLSSHSIVEMRKYVHNLPENSPELKKLDITGNRKINIKKGRNNLINKK